MDLIKAFNINDLFRMDLKKRDSQIVVGTHSSAVTGSGASYFSNPVMYIKTGASIGSTAMIYNYLFGQFSDLGTYYPDFTRRHWVSFNISTTTDNASVVRYLRFEYVDTPSFADISSLGFGIKLANLSLLGESYGSQRGEVSLGTIEVNRTYKIVIDHNPAQGYIKWYLDGVLVGEQTTAAAIPNEDKTISEAVYFRFAMSIGNVDSTADARLYASDIRILEVM